MDLKRLFGERSKKNWFYETVSNSDASFKVLITSSPILGPDKKNKNDNLSNEKYSHEQGEILDFIKKQNNLFIVNGDRHWQYVTHIDGTNLWEFGCGAGTDSHSLQTQGGWNRGDPEPEHEFLRLKGGFLSVEASRAENKPSISFFHHDVDGEIVSKKTFFSYSQN
jgi:alkaline phosphatase D